MAVRFPEMPQPVDPAETHINHLFDHLIACLNQRRIELLATVRDTRLEMAARLAARAREEQELIGLRADTERRLQMNPLRETQLEILAKLDEKLSEVRRPLPDTRLMFRSATRDLEQLILGVGEVVEEVVPTVPRYHELRPIVAVVKRGQAPGEIYCPNGVAIDSNTNQIYVAEGDWVGFARVSIFSETGEFLNSFTHEHMKKPSGIAIHRDNVYVTDCSEHFVFHFKLEVDIRLVARLGGEGSGDGQFDVPRQLTVSTNGDVYVADYNNRRIKILNSDLYYQRHISHHSMTHPCDVKLTPDEVYVLSDTDSPCVHVFSHAGDKIRSLITRGVGMQVIGSWFFCLDANGNFIISDCSANQIKIFSKEGALIHTLGEEGDEVGMFWYPRGIALTNNLKLVSVSLNRNYCLQIYSSD